MQNKTVAIVGSHPRTKDLAPFTDKTIDIWVFNEVVGRGHVPRADAVFQMHKPPIWKNPANRNDPKHYEWLQQPHDFPIYMMEAFEDVPAAVAYPLDVVCDTLVPHFSKALVQIRYFTSSIAYAIALAIFHGYERIELYGVEMETNTEYGYQRDGVYFWIGVALGRGIEFTLCAESKLFDSPLYGYQGDVVLNPEEFDKRLDVLTPLVPQHKQQVELSRAEQDAALKAAAADPEKRAESLQRFYRAIKQQAGAAIELGRLLGTIDENKRYQDKAKTMLDAANSVLFSRQEFEQSASKAQEYQANYESLMHTNGAAAMQAWNMLQQMADASQKARNRQTSIYLEAHEKYMQAALQFGRFTGIVHENMSYLEKVDSLVRMAGGEKSEAVMLESMMQREAVNA